MIPPALLVALGACLLLTSSVSRSQVAGTAPSAGHSSRRSCVSKRHADLVCPDSAALNLWHEVASRGVLKQLRMERVDGQLELPQDLTTHLTVLDLTSSGTTSIVGEGTEGSDPLDFSHLNTLILTDNPTFDLTSLVKLGDVSSLTSLHLSGINIGVQNTTGSYEVLVQVLAKVPKLQTLNMTDCGLKDLDYYSLSGLLNLRFLNISNNPLQHLNQNFKVLHRLEELSMSNCSLEQVFVVPAEDDIHQFATKSLRLLDLSFNKLSEIYPSLVYAMADSGTLDVTGNPLEHSSCALFPLYFFHEGQKGGPGGVIGATEALNNFPSVNIPYCSWRMCPERCFCVPRTRTVECVGAGLTVVPPFGPSEAEELYLNDNNISSLEGLGSDFWTNLRSLYIDNNKLTSLSVPGSTLPRLYHLSVKDNSLSTISAEDCPLLASLLSLNITGNNFVSINASPCGYLRLTELDVSKNYIKDLPPVHMASLPFLQFLNASRNSVNFLSQKTLDKVPSLRLFDASWNHLTVIDTRQNILSPYSSQTRRSLEHLLLDYNFLTDLGVLHELGLPNTSSLQIDGNPWDCSCSSNLESHHLPNLLGGQCLNSKTPVRDFLLNRDAYCSPQEENNNKRKSKTNNIWYALAGGVMGAVLLVSTLCVVRQCSHFCRTLRTQTVEPEVQNQNDLFILHHWDDIVTVDEGLIPHLCVVVPGVPLLHCSNMDIYGRPFREAFEPYLRSIGKVLVVVSEASFEDSWFRILLKRCYREHLRQENNFLMMALLMEDAPTIEVLTADRDFHFLVIDRPYVLYADGDYMRQIVQFLLPGGTAPGSAHRSRSVSAESLC